MIALIQYLKKASLLLMLAFVFTTCGKEGDSVSPNQTGTGGSKARFTILGDYLYVVDSENLKVFNISSVNNPEFIKSVRIGFQIETIFPFKDRLFIGSTSAVYFYSVADPANPVQVSQAIEPTIMRRCDPVVANDSVAYATLNTSGPCGGTQSILVVYDIRNLTSPTRITTRNVNSPNGLGFKDSTLYVCDGPNGLIVYDIKNAWNPKQITVYGDGDYMDVIPYGDWLYCWTKQGLLIYNIQNPESPSKLTEIL
jgi:hypothetical protein